MIRDRVRIDSDLRGIILSYILDKLDLDGVPVRAALHDLTTIILVIGLDEQRRMLHIPSGKI